MRGKGRGRTSSIRGEAGPRRTSSLTHPRAALLSGALSLSSPRPLLSTPSPLPNAPVTPPSLSPSPCSHPPSLCAAPSLCQPHSTPLSLTLPPPLLSPQVLVEECNRQYSDLALRAAPLGFELEASLALWQLPSELLGAEEPADIESLKRSNAELKQQLKAAKERIAYLEGASSASKAQRHLHELRKQMVAAKADGTYRSRTGAPDGSKACSIQ